MTATANATLPSFESRLDEIAAAERDAGWLSACADADQFLAVNRQLVTSLVGWLRGVNEQPIVEVCAGRGELAEALAAGGLPLVPTDADPPASSSVLRASAEEALRQYRPVVVLGCFVPIDVGVDEVVLGCPWVRHYLVLGARVGGAFGSASLWKAPGWTSQPLYQLSRWMLTRHDVWTGLRQPPILPHGEAWCFSRRQSGYREPCSDHPCDCGSLEGPGSSAVYCPRHGQPWRRHHRREPA